MVGELGASLPKSLESADGGGQLAEATRGQAGQAAQQEGLEALATPHRAQVRGGQVLIRPPPGAHV